MALAFAHQGKKFVYSADAGHSPEVEALTKDADLLLHWCNSLDSEEVSQKMTEVVPTPFEIGEMAKRAGVHSLILTHFRKHMETAADHDQSIKNT